MFPEFVVPDDLPGQHGQIQTVFDESSRCMEIDDPYQISTTQPTLVEWSSCRVPKYINNQFYGLRGDGLIESFITNGDPICLTVTKYKGEKVITAGKCHDGRDNIMFHWELIDQGEETFRIRHRYYRLCIDSRTVVKVENQVALRKCDQTTITQLLRFTMDPS